MSLFREKNQLFSLNGYEIFVVISEKLRHTLSLFQYNFTLTSIKRSRETILSL